MTNGCMFCEGKLYFCAVCGAHKAPEQQKQLERKMLSEVEKYNANKKKPRGDE